MTEHQNLAAALAAFQAEMPVVAKSKTAKVQTKAGGSYSYTYADLADVTEVAMPVLSRHGLSFTASPRMTDGGNYELVGILRHTSGDRDEGALPIKGNTPQELGGSITYARRYLLGSMTGIVTDNDDDGALASGRAASKRTATAPEAPTTGGRKMSRPNANGSSDPITPEQVKKLAASMNERGLTDRDRALEFVASVIGRDVASRNELTKAEASKVIDALEAAA